MADEPDYNSLSKRFESFAERASDPSLAESYRKLARTYRALDFWHERFRNRYEAAVDLDAEARDTHDPADGKPGPGKPPDDER